MAATTKQVELSKLVTEIKLDSFDENGNANVDLYMDEDEDFPGFCIGMITADGEFVKTKSFADCQEYWNKTLTPNHRKKILSKIECLNPKAAGSIFFDWVIQHPDFQDQIQEVIKNILITKKTMFNEVTQLIEKNPEVINTDVLPKLTANILQSIIDKYDL